MLAVDRRKLCFFSPLLLPGNDSMFVLHGLGIERS